MIQRFQIRRGAKIVYDASFLDGEGFAFQPSDFHEGLAGYEFRVFPEGKPRREDG